MKYLCQVWFDGGVLDAMTKEEKAELDTNSLNYDKDLVESGHMIVAQALQSPKSAVTEEPDMVSVAPVMVYPVDLKARLLAETVEALTVPALPQNTASVPSVQG